MKKLLTLFTVFLLSFLIFAETNAHDTQAAIVNSLLIQQMMNNMNQENQKNQNQSQDQNAEEKSKKKRINNEDDLLDMGYKRFRLGDAEDYFVFKTSGHNEYEVDIWAVDKRGRLAYYGSILVGGKKGYKGNPLDHDLDEYRCCWLKVLNDENAIIKALGERHNDQYFEIQ